jgi:hypothetical protein
VITYLLQRVFFIERSINATFFSPSSFVANDLLVGRLVSGAVVCSGCAWRASRGVSDGELENGG